VNTTIVQGDKLDMNALYATFAMKSKPDDTINRIVALEALTKGLGEKLDHSASKADLDSLVKRVA
jgi:hypothetical protein